MQIKEIVNDKLKRKYQVCIPAVVVQEKTEAFLLEKGKTAKIKGYRPGKLPLSILKRHFAKEALQNVLSALLKDGYAQILKTFDITPAVEPQYHITTLEEKKDLDYTVTLEIAPTVPSIQWSDLVLNRYKPHIENKHIHERLQALAEQNRSTRAYPQPQPAQAGDTLIADVEIRGQTKDIKPQKIEKWSIELTEKTFIPNLVERLVQAQQGDVIQVPWETQGQQLTVTFSIHEVRETLSAQIDEALAKALKFQGLKDLESAVQKTLEQEGEWLASSILKKEIFDYLDQHYIFDVPEKLLQKELDHIWQGALQEMGLRNENSPKDTPERRAVFQEKAGCTEEEFLAQHKQIAERRVRLAFILGQIAQAHALNITPEEVKAAVLQKAQQHPQQQGQIVQFYQKNPRELELLLQPVFEEKVTAFITRSAQIHEQALSLDELKILSETPVNNEGQAAP